MGVVTGRQAEPLAVPVVTRRTASPRAVLAVAVLGTFMAFVDATIVNIAVPSIAHEFPHSTLSSISWVLNAYNIVFAAFLVGGGQLADLLGRRRVFSFSLITFTLASALCAAAPSLGLLVAARIVQAAGAAMLVPSSLAIVLEAHEQRERMHAVALWAAVAALAAGIGPPLGGLLVTASSWRLVFLVNIPVGAIALVLGHRVLVESRAPGRRRVPDVLGAVTLALAIASLVLGVVKGQEWGWSSARVLGAFALALALGAYFVFRSSRQRTPVVDLGLMRIPAFALSNGVTIIMASGFYAYTLCNVLFLTGVWRYSILEAGLALTPGPLTAMAVAVPASRLVERVGHRAVIVPGALLWGAGMAYFATTLGVRPDFLGNWLPGMLILGAGAGLSFPTLSGAAVGSVPGPRFAVATALNSVSRQVGAALGVAILVAIIGTPSARDALHAFQRGWTFAGGCFLAGRSCVWRCVVSTSSESDGADLAIGSRRLAEHEEPEPRGLPSLAESLGEHADDGDAERGRLPALRARVRSALARAGRRGSPALASSVSLRRGEWLFHEGEQADGVYVLRLGHLEVLQEEAAAGDDQHADPRRGARRARAAQRLAAQCVGPRDARQRAADDRQGELPGAAALRTGARARPHARAERAAAGEPRDPGREARHDPSRSRCAHWLRACRCSTSPTVSALRCAPGVRSRCSIPRRRRGGGGQSCARPTATARNRARFERSWRAASRTTTTC